MTTLRKRAIKLAYDNPGPVRDALLPILAKTAVGRDQNQALKNIGAVAEELAGLSGQLHGTVEHTGGHGAPSVVRAVYGKDSFDISYDPSWEQGQTFWNAEVTLPRENPWHGRPLDRKFAAALLRGLNNSGKQGFDTPGFLAWTEQLLSNVRRAVPSFRDALADEYDRMAQAKAEAYGY